MSHGFYEVSRGGGDKASDTLSRHKPDPVFVAAMIAQHKTELRSRLANSLRFSKKMWARREAAGDLQTQRS